MFERRINDQMYKWLTASIHELKTKHGIVPFSLSCSENKESHRILDSKPFFDRSCFGAPWPFLPVFCDVILLPGGFSPQTTPAHPTGYWSPLSWSYAGCPSAKPAPSQAPRYRRTRLTCDHISALTYELCDLRWITWNLQNSISPL